ncbi:uncharacterized protein RAG0_14497 [Rhynchosporium agropyri]|uniref:Uncharacterized protein n=1 Tax=Rhynchosporium agropyri TaxID=914238 RepID=A0A1E1LHB6_9HELO|nr:uncharacterized protein RAG0_14497 [Rhynchosporium agropyri]
MAFTLNALIFLGSPVWRVLWFFVLCFLMNAIGLQECHQERERAINNWLIRHFARLRKHQYRMVEQSGKAAKDIAEVVRICQRLEMQSLLCYPHDHITECKKDCKLGHGDMLVVFGEDRGEPFPPRLERRERKGKAPRDIDDASDGDQQKDGQNTGEAETKVKDSEGKELEGSEIPTSESEDASSRASTSKAKGPHPQKKKPRKKW